MMAMHGHKMSVTNMTTAPQGPVADGQFVWSLKELARLRVKIAEDLAKVRANLVMGLSCSTSNIPLNLTLTRKYLGNDNNDMLVFASASREKHYEVTFVTASGRSPTAVPRYSGASMEEVSRDKSYFK